MNIRLVLIFLPLILLCVAIKAWFVIRASIKSANTYDTIGLVMTSMDRNLTQQSWKAGYNVISEAKREFPQASVNEGEILDAWGNAIHIKIQRNYSDFSFIIISSGPDGAFGTDDDLERRGTIKD